MSKEIQNIINDYSSLRKKDQYSSDEDLMMIVLKTKGILPYKNIDSTERELMLKANIISAQFYLMLLSNSFEDVINFYGNWDNMQTIEEKAKDYMYFGKKVKSLTI